MEIELFVLLGLTSLGRSVMPVKRISCRSREIVLSIWFLILVDIDACINIYCSLVKRNFASLID